MECNKKNLGWIAGGHLSVSDHWSDSPQNYNVFGRSAMNTTIRISSKTMLIFFDFIRRSLMSHVLL
jgi:hypothetical protein